MRYDRIRRVLVVVVAGLLFLPAALFSLQRNPSQRRSVRHSFASGIVTVNCPGAAEAIPAQGNVPIEEGSEVAKSHARVVRLSYVSGTVMLTRPGSAEEEKALLNTPIQEGFTLFTSGGSYAEVEFENGSTARIGENSKLLFHRLALDANGDKLNGMTFEQGYATFHFLPEHAWRKEPGEDGAIHFEPANSDVYHVKIADATVTADGKCEFRTDMAPDRFRLEVFSGAVVLTTATQSAKVGEGKSLEHKLGSTELAFNTKDGIARDAWDQWTEARDKQVQLTQKDESVHANGLRYGWSDLDTYGEWVTLPGGRYGWSPYSRAGWGPYSNGMWEWYPGLGWTWISGEPWGWVTDHCGWWDFDDSFGWFWMNPMFGCGLWNASLVNWYSGAGWIGWRPRPKPIPPGHPRPGHPGAGIVVVPTAVVQNRQKITPQMVNHVPLTIGTLIAHPPFEPNPRPLHTATSPASASLAPALMGRGGAGFAMHRASAPSAVLMGGDPAKERSFISGHLFHSSHAPLRAADGTTLGGRYAVHGSPGEFRGNALSGGGRNSGAAGVSGHAAGPGTSHSSGASGGAVISSHGSSGGGFSGGGGGHSGGGFSGGGGHSGGGGTVSSGGGGAASSAGSGGGHH